MFILRWRGELSFFLSLRWDIEESVFLIGLLYTWIFCYSNAAGQDIINTQCIQS